MTDVNTGNSNDFAEARVRVNSELGLHARPAARLVKLAQSFTADINLCLGDLEVDAKSILDILSLAATGGSVLTLRCKGEDALGACESLELFFKDKLESVDG